MDAGEHPPELSLVLPCYNEAEHIDRSLPRLVQVLDALSISYELICVDDCSRDDTRIRLSRLAARYPAHSITLLHHPRNAGRGAAVRSGFQAARGSIVGYLDVDLEVDAVYVLSMIVALRKGADAAVATRIYRVQPRYFHRHLLSRAYLWAVRRMLALPYIDTEAGYKFFRRPVALSLLERTRDPGWFWDTEVLFRAHEMGVKVAEIPCLFQRDEGKTSTVKPLSDSVEYLRRLVAFRRGGRRGWRAIGPVR